MAHLALASEFAVSAACLAPRLLHLHGALVFLLMAAGGLVGATPGCVEARASALSDFHKKWEGEPLVLLKWIALQVMLGFDLVCRLGC